jgi:hypothetical protein
MMKKDLNEEIYKMRTMMGLNEQKFLTKVKTAAQNLGGKIQTGVNQVAQKIADKTKPQQQVIQEPQQKGKTYEEIRAEWTKINSDMTNMRGFGEGTSREQNLARQMGEFNARVAIIKKMGKQNAQFGSTIYYGENDEFAPKLFMTKEGVYNYLVVMEKTD